VEGSTVTDVGVLVGSGIGVGVLVARMIGVGVAFNRFSVGVGSTLMTNPIAILSTMSRLSTYRTTCDTEGRRFEEDLLVRFRRAIVLLRTV
jgi:hypothetical protein